MDGTRPGLVQLTQGENCRAALGWADQRFFPAGISLLESRQQRIVGGELIDAAVTLWTIGEMGRDVGQLFLRELFLGQLTQRFVTWMLRLGLGHDMPNWVRRTDKRQRRFSVKNR